MNPKTPKALAQFSLILVVVGIIVGDPLAGFFFFSLAGILTALALAFGSTKVRVIALVVLVTIIALAVWKYPDARRHLDQYRERAHADRQSSAAPTGTSRGVQ